MMVFATTTHRSIRKPNRVINDHSHLPILLLGNQFKTASTQLLRALGVFGIAFDR